MRCLLVTSLIVITYLRVVSTSECVGLTDDQVAKLKQNKVKEKVASKLTGEYTAVWVPKGLGEKVKCAEEKYYMANDVLRKSTTPIFKDDIGNESDDESKHNKKHKGHKKKKKDHDKDEESKEKSKEKEGKSSEVKDKEKEKKGGEVKDKEKEKKGGEVKDKEKKGSEAKQGVSNKENFAENKDHKEKEKKGNEGKEKEKKGNEGKEKDTNKGTDDKKDSSQGKKEGSQEHKGSSGENSSGHKHKSRKNKHDHKHGKKHGHKRGKKKGHKLQMFEVEDGVFEMKSYKRHKTVEKLFMVYASNDVFAFVSCDIENGNGKKKKDKEHEQPPPVRSFIILKKGKTVDDSDIKADYSQAKKKMDNLGVEVTKEMVQLTEKC